MSPNNQEIVLKAHNRVDKKYLGDPSYLLRKRVINTVASVLDKIDGMSFEDLASDNFFICREVGFKYFSDKYRSVLEFAKVQPEKLADELYKMFRDTGKEIKKSGRLEEFFLFLSLFEENTAVSERYEHVYLAYLDLLMEQTEFLKSNVYDINHIVAGLTTDGEVLLTNDLFPNIDLPVYEFTRSGSNTKAVFEKILNKYGFKDENEYRFCCSASTIYQNNVLLLVPYINEYTFDMLPLNMYSPSTLTTLITSKDLNFTDRLKNRHKTLPTNGAVVYFQDSVYLKTATLKEIFYNNTIHMLCKFETAAGDVTVRYNTKTGVFFSPFDHMGGYSATLHNTVKQLALWLYSAYVCPNEDILPTTESYHNFTDDKNASLSFTSIGGKLRQTLNRELNKHIDYERYTEKTVSIAGYIRKLPDGQKASDEKKELARLLGLSLSENETYVSPHKRKYWELKFVESREDKLQND